ncbi:hypothetical protein F4604DRAFT_1728732 [Suillus subluteus]|nr:hypothetical protein F4604DRAFT_1728732 [Suillus subluteus]
MKFCSKKYGNYKVPHTSSECSFVFVKRGTTNLEAEARTQAHFYDQAQNLSGGPRVARVYEVFEDRHGSTYLVMEYIDAPSFEDLINGCSSGLEKANLHATAITKIADTITWLLGCPVPDGDSVGPVGGGKIQHAFFGMEEAPIEFASSQALEAYINEALSHLPGRSKRRIDLAVETRAYSPSDIALKNFLWDGQVISFVDWQHVSLLPHCLASFYFHGTTDKLVQAIANQIDLPRSEKLELIATAAGSVVQGGTSDYGLNKYGKKYSV